MILLILSTKHFIGFFDWSPNKLNRDSNETPLCIFQEFFSIFEGNRGNCAHRPGRFISSPLILSPALRPPSFFGSLDQVSGQFSVGSLLA